MAKMHKDEITVLKSLMIEIDTDNLMLVTMQYHVEPREDGKVDRSKSKYRWLARVMPKTEVKDIIKFCWADENRLNRWKWPNDTWPYYIYAGESDNRTIGSWLATKLNKIQKWEDGVKQLYGWKKKTPSHPVAEYVKKAMYVHSGYTADNGDTVDLTDKDALLKHIGQNLFHPQVKDIVKYANENPPKDAIA